jgi:hypothetical protein
MSTLVDLPGDMRDAASALDRDIRETMNEVEGRRSVLTGQDAGTGQGWLYGTGLGNWWSAGSVSMDAINARRAQLLAWRSQLVNLTGQALDTPTPEKPAPPTDPLGLGKLSAMLPWVVAAVVLVLLAPSIVGGIKAARG